MVLGALTGCGPQQPCCVRHAGVFRAAAQWTVAHRGYGGRGAGQDGVGGSRPACSLASPMQPSAACRRQVQTAAGGCGRQGARCWAAALALGVWCQCTAPLLPGCVFVGACDGGAAKRAWGLVTNNAKCLPLLLPLMALLALCVAVAVAACAVVCMCVPVCACMGVPCAAVPVPTALC